MSDHRSYSRIRVHGGLALTAGILGRGDDGDLVSGGTAAEFDRGLDILDGHLDELGVGRSEVLRLVVYLADIGDLVAMDEVFRQRFDDPRPTRTTVQVAALPGGASVEVEATIALD